MLNNGKHDAILTNHNISDFMCNIFKNHKAVERSICHYIVV